MSDFKNYFKKLEGDAKDFLDYYFDDFLDDIKGGYGNDYHGMIDGNDGKLHDHIDQELDLNEASDILDQCINEETDSGMWNGLPPREAISSQAFWSYKNDILYHEIPKQMKEKLEDILDEKGGKLEGLEQEYDELKEELTNIDEDEEELEEKIETLSEEIDDLQEVIDNIEDFINKELNHYLKSA